MKKKSVFRSMFTLALSLVMMLSLAASASAASITIKNSDGQPRIGDATRFVAYQIFKGSLSTEHSGGGKELVGITWGDGVNSTNLVTALKSSDLPLDSEPGSTFGKKFTAAWNEWNADHTDSISEEELVAQFLSSHLANREYADDFAKIAAAHTNGSGISSAFTSDESGWVINLAEEDGYYLVKDTYMSKEGNNEPDGAVSSYILQVSGNAIVTIKSTIPTVEKKVQGADGYLAEIGQDVTFTLTGTVAENIGEYDTYAYTFTDTLSKGLTIETLDATKIRVMVGETTFAFGTDYKATVAKGSDGANILTVKFEDLKAAAKKYNVTLGKGSEIVVTYYAKLNASAVVANTATAGNPNSVTLTYSNNPYGEGTGESVPDEVKTYTLSLDVEKQNAENEPLGSVKFKLKNGADQYAALEEVRGSTGDTIEYYALKGWDTTGTELVTGTDGKFHIHGLSAGNYTLVELEAPAGYETMKDIVFDITGGEIQSNGSLGDLDWKLNRLNEHRTDAVFSGSLKTGTATLTLTNYKAPILPNTGGIGAKIVYVVSGLAVLIGLCIVAAALKKRKGDKA